MAEVLYGAGIQEFRGAIGGTVFQRCGSQPSARGRRRPINPRSSYQLPVRYSLAYHATRWLTELDASQRLAWATYAATYPFYSKLGREYLLSGFQMFLRSNRLGYRLSGTEYDDPPALPGGPNIFPVTFDFDHATRTLAIDSVDGSPTANDQILLNTWQIDKATRHRIIRPYYANGNLALNAATPITVSVYPDPLPGSVGLICACITWYHFDADARFSSRHIAWTISS
jgi:hypothetical protein